MSKVVWVGGVCATVMAMAAVSSPALAREVSAEETVVSDVVVTARKRTETVYDVPAPISVVTGDQIEALKLNDARDLVMMIPTAFLQEGIAGSARDFNIRGVGTPSLFVEAGVAQYVDGVYVSSFISHPTQFYDLERVEVLRGPQGGLYGRNAVGGAVNILSKGPTDTFSTQIEATRANHDRFEVRGIVNMPVSDAFGLRATAWYVDQNDGEYLNPVTDQYLDAESSSGLRLVGDLSLSSDLDVRLVGELTNASAPGTVPYFPGLGETGANVPRDTQPVNDIDTWRLSAEARLKTGLGDFTLIAGVRRYDLHGLEDTDLLSNAGSPAQRVVIRDNTVDARYVELRWAGSVGETIDLLGGITYLNDDGVGRVLSVRPGQLEPGGIPATVFFDNDQTLRSWSAFGEALIDLGPDVTLTLDLRYTRDKKSVDFALTPSPLTQGVFGVPQRRELSETFENWSPGATLEWRPSENFKVYAKAQTGFRAGGFNFNVAKVANLPYDEETSVNYEIGAKGRLLDGKLTWGASIYQLTQEDVLVSQFDFTASTGLQGYLANVGAAETNGFEFEFAARLVDGLTLGGTVGVLDAEFTSGSTFGAPLAGKELPSSRPLTWSLYGLYERELSTDLLFRLNLSYAHRDSGFLDTTNATKMSESGVLNGTVALDFRNLTVEGYVQNALDDRYDLTYGGFRSGQFGIIRAPGERYGVTLRAKF